MIKYTVTCSLRLEKAKKFPRNSIHPRVIDVCIQLGTLVSEIAGWVDRISHGEVGWSFPINAGELRSLLFKRQAFIVPDATRMTAFLDCEVDNETVFCYLLRCEVITLKGRVVLPTICFSNFGDYRSYSVKGSILDTP